MKYVIYPIAAVLIGGLAMAALGLLIVVLGFAWHRLAGLPPEWAANAGGLTMVALVLAAAGVAYAKDEL